MLRYLRKLVSSITLIIGVIVFITSIFFLMAGAILTSSVLGAIIGLPLIVLGIALFTISLFVLVFQQKMKGATSNEVGEISQIQELKRLEHATNVTPEE